MTWLHLITKINKGVFTQTNQVPGTYIHEIMEKIMTIVRDKKTIFYKQPWLKWNKKTCHLGK